MGHPFTHHPAITKLVICSPGATAWFALGAQIFSAAKERKDRKEGVGKPQSL
jgi:hypothetical protein